MKGKSWERQLFPLAVNLGYKAPAQNIAVRQILVSLKFKDECFMCENVVPLLTAVNELALDLTWLSVA